MQRLVMIKHIHVLLADDQSKVRSALRLVLEQQPGVHILGEAVDTTGLLDWVKTARPDLVLLDWELPGLQAANPLIDSGRVPSTALRQAQDGSSGQGLLPTLRELCPGMAVIALSGRPERRPIVCQVPKTDTRGRSSGNRPQESKGASERLPRSPEG